jgi:hypothetical protein
LPVRSRNIPLVVRCALLIAAITTTGGAQTAQAGQAAQLARIDSLYVAGAAEPSYTAAIAAVNAAPEDYESLWRAARAETIRGALAGGTNAAKAAIFVVAEGYARRAIARDAVRPEGHYWLAGAMGLHSREVSPFAAARLSAGVRDEALRILAIDSLDAGGHGLLGRVNSGGCLLNPVLRAVASAVFGAGFTRGAPCETAVRELKRAIALDPAVILYRADLVELYARRDRIPEAQRVLAGIDSLAQRTPVDSYLVSHSHALLDEARRRR